MKVIDIIKETIDNKYKTIVTIGNFDGVHSGHRYLIDTTVQKAYKNGLKSVVITFEPHTKFIVGEEKTRFNILTTFEEKERLLKDIGVDYLVRIPFTKEFSNLTTEQFIEEFLVKKLNTVEWIMGEGHTIGKNRENDNKYLHNLVSKYHINLFIVKLLRKDDSVISSTKIRKNIITGNIINAIEMLGHPYLIAVKRTKGLGLASSLGFPTLNFATPSSEKVIPPAGVYAAKLEFNNIYENGALYFGESPTLAKREIHFEFYSIEKEHPFFPETGEKALLWLYNFIRGDKIFSSKELLGKQIKNDVKKIEQFFIKEKSNATN